LRNWYKYTLEKSRKKNFSSALDYTSHQIKKKNCELDKLFEFNFFYLDFSKYIYDYLSKKLYGNNLSIGSGWGHLEYHLSHKFNITALDINNEYAKYNKKIKYLITDIISKDFDLKFKYDNIFAPGIIYLFNEKELNVFFKNIKKIMLNNGNFYLFFRSNDSLFINFLDNFILPFENIIKFFLKIIRNQKVKIQKNLHGFRRYNKELEKVIVSNDLKIVLKKELMFQAEYNRSKILRLLCLNKILSLFKLHPYITVYHLKKLL
jgi:hypothetical protein